MLINKESNGEFVIKKIPNLIRICLEKSNLKH